MCVEEADRDFQLYEGWIAGYSYYDGPNIRSDLHRGQIVQLRREPDNSLDKYAIEVLVGNGKLGYINSAHNEMLARLMDNGFEFRAWINEFGRSGYVSKMVKVEVWMDKLYDINPK